MCLDRFFRETQTDDVPLTCGGLGEEEKDVFFTNF